MFFNPIQPAASVALEDCQEPEPSAIRYLPGPDPRGHGDNVPGYCGGPAESRRRRLGQGEKIRQGFP